MSVGDLVMCKFFKKYGIIIEEPRYMFEGHQGGTSGSSSCMRVRKVDRRSGQDETGVIFRGRGCCSD